MASDSYGRLALLGVIGGHSAELVPPIKVIVGRLAGQRRGGVYPFALPIVGVFGQAVFRRFDLAGG